MKQFLKWGCEEKFNTLTHWSGIIASRPITVPGTTAAEGFWRTFRDPFPAGEAFHKSIPILRLAAGTETNAFPGTEPATVFCALAPKNRMPLDYYEVYNEKEAISLNFDSNKVTICEHLMKTSFLPSWKFLKTWICISTSLSKYTSNWMIFHCTHIERTRLVGHFLVGHKSKVFFFCMLRHLMCILDYKLHSCDFNIYAERTWLVFSSLPPSDDPSLPLSALCLIQINKRSAHV